jgi:hypothetical protein
MDRLSSYIYWGENREDLDNAVLVAKTQRFGRSKIKKFCDVNKRLDVYKEFIDLAMEND